jgi:hypothetical protein
MRLYDLLRGAYRTGGVVSRAKKIEVRKPWNIWSGVPMFNPTTRPETYSRAVRTIIVPFFLGGMAGKRV